MERKVRCIIHGSFRKDLELIMATADRFSQAGVEVLAPAFSEKAGETDGFVHLASDESKDPRMTELLYLQKLAALGPEGFSYYVNPQGTIGTSASYELAMDQVTNTRYLFMKPLKDHPAYVPKNSVWMPAHLADYIAEHRCYPPPVIPQDEEHIQRMVQELILPGSVIAVGAIIVDHSDRHYRQGQERDVLLVQTHKWQGRFSIVGGKVRRNERLADALQREIQEETGLDSAIEESICTFDELRGGNYYLPSTHRVFTDNVVMVPSRKVALNEEAEHYTWMPASAALRDLDIEPNAKKTLELYREKHRRVA